MLNFKSINILFIGLLLSIIIFSNPSFFSMFLLFFAWSTITMLGSFNIRWNYFMHSKNNDKKSNKHHIYLTFDDGPNEVFTPKVLELLKQYNAKATFFCIGEKVQQHPKIFQQIIDEGHAIGNHSFSHKPIFGFLSTNAVVNDIEKMQTLIKKEFNLDIKLFRPPFGITNPNIANATSELGLEPIGWSVRSFDTFFKKPQTILKMILPQIQKGSIVLLHDKSHNSVLLLEVLLIELQRKGLTSQAIEVSMQSPT